MPKANTKPSKAATILEFDTDAIKAREREVAKETDEQILDRLRERFDILTEMTKAVKSGDVRAMIVSGPPGVGKSYGVEQVLQKDGIFDTLGERKPRFEVVKGAMSAIGLYAKLYEYSDAKNVLVFDDCDSILMEDLSLNILKGALDSNAKRVIAWNTDSRLLRSEGIPDKFEFKGAAIFITNIKFEHVRSKKLRDHLDALESRCHYIDLQMDTNREKILRIKQVVRENDMLGRYEFDQVVKDEVVEFIEKNQDRVRELSLRMVLKIADLRKSFPKTWQAMAKTTCFRRA
jgi:predicted AAA+ superfamily ATPase